MSDSFGTRQGSLWIQLNGPNTEPVLLSCKDLGDVEEPAGDIKPVLCQSPNGGWETKGSLQSPPDNVSTSIDALLFPEVDALERIVCKFGLFAIETMGRVDIISGASRVLGMMNCRLKTRKYSKLVAREDEESSMLSVDVVADNPMVKTGMLKLARMTTTFTLALNDAAVLTEDNCFPGKKGFYVGDGAVAAKAPVDKSVNYGVTWAASATQPFAVNENIESVAVVRLNSTTNRIIAALKAPVGAQGKIAYSDDNGTTWTVVNVGGAAAGHGALDAGALFALDRTHVWLASNLGYIYFSADAGVTWSVQSSGATVQPLHGIAFDKTGVFGMAVGATDAILYTVNGGQSWTLATATGDGGVLNSVSYSGSFWWIGTASGKLYYSNDGGVTWTARTTFTGYGTGSIDDVLFANQLVGFALHNTAAPVGTIMRTLDGGFTWEDLTTPSNSGLNALALANENFVIAVGEANAGTGVVIKATWE